MTLGISSGELIEGRKAPWQQASGLRHVLETWKSNPRIWKNVAGFHYEPEKAACNAEFPATLSADLRRVLQQRGVETLYSHQAQAIACALSGKSVVVATPTASGKSLCYHLPVIQALASDRCARALYLFPTKALCRDQEVSLREMMQLAGLDQGAITYDGDTPGDARRAARERAGILITNPDMLHAGILPHHTLWARFFANLRYIVIDEVHSYRGVFGSHLANVLCRLMRVAQFHGSSPVAIAASATIGNPQEHASAIVGADVALVNESGAPQGPRHMLVYNPPVLNAELGIRESYLKATVRLAYDLIVHQVPTLVFGQSRNNVEVMLKYLRDRLATQGVPAETVQGYRGGYLPDTRRRIEKGLREGGVRAVVATNALELGIDIGSLDAIVCAGYPGSVAALYQRWGRGGRRLDESLALLVTSSAPLDQYLARDPNFVIGAPVEHARIDPYNPEVLIQHLKCAAFELPFSSEDRFGALAKTQVAGALDMLAQHNVLHTTWEGDKAHYHWSSDSYPANHVSLRSVGWDNFVVIDVAKNETIAEMDWRATHTMLHEQAIYQHEGRQYQVERLDFENHKAYVRYVEPDYYTDALTHTRVSILEQNELDTSKSNGPEIGWGEVSVVEKVVGYKKIKYHTHENVGYGDVHLPEMQMHTTALWLIFRETLLRSWPWPRAVAMDVIRGLGHALHTVAAVGLMVDPRDLGVTIGQPQPGEQGAAANDDFYDPTLFIFDRIPGGVGLASRLFEVRPSLLERAAALIGHCPCALGCPACIGPTLPLAEDPWVCRRKELALNLLSLQN